MRRIHKSIHRSEDQDPYYLTDPNPDPYYLTDPNQDTYYLTDPKPFSGEKTYLLDQKIDHFLRP